MESEKIVVCEDKFDECESARLDNIAAYEEQMENFDKEIKERNDWITYYTAVVDYIDAMSPTLKELETLFDDPECLKITGSKSFDDDGAKNSITTAEELRNDYQAKADAEIALRDIAQEHYDTAKTNRDAEANRTCAHTC